LQLQSVRRRAAIEVLDYWYLPAAKSCNCANLHVVLHFNPDVLLCFVSFHLQSVRRQTPIEVRDYCNLPAASFCFISEVNDLDHFLNLLYTENFLLLKF
jgi:hypothetical protein